MRRIVLATAAAGAGRGGGICANAGKLQGAGNSENLHGAAEKSFMTKCARDAKTACDAQATEKKFAGAAKNSFTKKCVTDRTGA